ncbi:MAG: 8-oxo-dGTP diphosphatase [Candidatus Omnitrophica bacterium]|nr:8-oxo-dGTP diphosphatase [Candidatus Omnitrophota bacterium]
MVVASTLCYIQKDGKTLMLHRVKKDADIHEGKWNGLGGKIDPGETPEECIIREVREESGLELKSPKLRGVMTFPEFKDREDWLVFLFTANTFSGKLMECNEGHLEWIDDHKVCDLNLWEGDKYFIEWLKKDVFFSAKFIYKDKKLIDHSVTFYD